MSDAEFKAVQVGCGAMGQRWVETAMKIAGVRIVGLVDVNPSAATQTAEKFHLPETIVHATLKDALAATDADVVFDVTVPEAHEAVVIEALGSGRHVLGEKPMSASMESARRMVAAAEKSGKTYAVTQNQRYAAPIRSLRTFLQGGRIGSLEEIHTDFYIGPHFGGFRDQMAFPLILDMAIHHFDAARFLSGADAQSVYCHSFNPKRSWYAGDASAVVIFEMTGGMVLSYRGSWCSQGQSTGWHCHWRILGNKGTVQWNGAETFEAEAVKSDGKTGFMAECEKILVPLEPMEFTAHEAIMREFFAALRQGKRPETDCRDNIKSLAMVLAAVESAETGRKIAVKW